MMGSERTNNLSPDPKYSCQTSQRQDYHHNLGANGVLTKDEHVASQSSGSGDDHGNQHNDQVLVFRDHFPGATNGSTPHRNCGVTSQKSTPIQLAASQNGHLLNLEDTQTGATQKDEDFKSTEQYHRIIQKQEQQNLVSEETLKIFEATQKLQNEIRRSMQPHSVMPAD